MKRREKEKEKEKEKENNKPNKTWGKQNSIAIQTVKLMK